MKSSHVINMFIRLFQIFYNIIQMKRLARLAGLFCLAPKFFCSSKKEKNFEFIDQIQWRANKPIEDRLAYCKLNQFPGYMISVFDGHGGDFVAQYASKTIQHFFNNRIKQNKAAGLSQSQICIKSLKETYDDIEFSYLNIFKQIKDIKSFQRVGACALTAIILKQQIIVANSGDCEGTLLGDSFTQTNKRFNAGQKFQQQRLKREFPNQEDIYKCHKNTNYCYVKGRLQPTRSLGDFYLKYPEYNFTKLKVFTGPYINHQPQITHFDLKQDHKYLVLATDGLWDELTHAEAHQVALKQKKNSFAQFKLSHSLLLAAQQKVKQRTKMTIQQVEASHDERDLHDDITIVSVDLLGLLKTL